LPNYPSVQIGAKNEDENDDQDLPNYPPVQIGPMDENDDQDLLNLPFLQELEEKKSGKPTKTPKKKLATEKKVRTHRISVLKKKRKSKQHNKEQDLLDKGEGDKEKKCSVM
jgi:hypothetical protein